MSDQTGSSQPDTDVDVNAPLALEAVVHGHVQGVGFRYWTWRHAEELGLTGCAQNLPDGTVRIRAEGPRWAVRELLTLVNSNDTPGAVMTVDSHFGPATGQDTEFSTR